MAAKYVVNIGGDRLLFDADRQPVEPDPEADIRNPDVPLPIWPVEQETATGSEWASALASYSPGERQVAKIRLLSTEMPE